MKGKKRFRKMLKEIEQIKKEGGVLPIPEIQTIETVFGTIHLVTFHDSMYVRDNEQGS